MFINLVIVLNTITVGLETEHACRSPSCQPRDLLLWSLLEIFFLSVFVIEAVLKILAWTWRGYWADNWNRFDFSLGFLGVIDLLVLGVILQPQLYKMKMDSEALKVGAESADSWLKIFQVLRVLRAFRLVRLVRLLRQFRELYVLVSGILEACKTLVWVAVLLRSWRRILR